MHKLEERANKCPLIYFQEERYCWGIIEFFIKINYHFNITNEEKLSLIFNVATSSTTDFIEFTYSLTGDVKNIAAVISN